VGCVSVLAESAVAAYLEEGRFRVACFFGGKEFPTRTRLISWPKAWLGSPSPRCGVSFPQKDFSGRIAGIRAVRYIVIRGVSVFVPPALSDRLLGLPALARFQR
jgi:hypothetical protein